MRLLGKLIVPLVLLGSVAVSPAKELPAIPADLATYLAKAEPDSGWKLEDFRDFGVAKVWRLKLSSQTWQGITWTHDLLVVRPADAPTGKMLLLNEGGSASEQKAMYAALLAGKIKAPVAILL